MVRHGRRAMAVAFAAALLGVGSADAFGAHACAHHDPLAAQDVGVASDGAHEPTAQHSPMSHGDDESHGPCTCVGECSGAADVLAVAVDLRARWSPVPHRPAFADAPYSHLPTVRSAYLLPLANAPPLV